MSRASRRFVSSTYLSAVRFCVLVPYLQHVMLQNLIRFVPQFVLSTPLKKGQIHKAISQQNALGNIMTLRGYMSKEWRIAVQSLKQDPSPTQQMCNLWGENGNFTTLESQGRSMARKEPITTQWTE